MADAAPDRRRQALEKAAASASTPEQRAKAKEFLAKLYPDAAPAPAAKSGPIPDPTAAVAPKGVMSRLKDYASEGLSAAGKQLDKEVTMIGSALGLVDPTPEGMELRRKVQTGADSLNRGISIGTYGPLMDSIGLDTPERRAAGQKEFPKTAMAFEAGGNLLGAALPGGPARIVDQAVTQTAAAAAPRIAQTAMGRIGTGIASGATQGGLTSSAEGRGLEDAPAGALGGAAGSVMGEVANLAGRGIRAASPTVADYSKHTSAGTYQHPEAQGRSPGPQGVQEAAEDAHRAIVRRDSNIVANDKEMYQDAIRPYIGGQIDRETAVAQLLEQMKANTDSRGKVKSEVLQKAYADALEYLGGTRANPEGPGFVHDPAPTLGDTMSWMGELREKAGFESTARTPENKAAGRVYGAAKSAVDSSVPAPVREARAEAHQNAAAGRRRRDLAWRTEGAINRGADDSVVVPKEDYPPELADQLNGMADDLDRGGMRVAKEQAGARLIKRIGDTNEPGVAAKSALDELALDPEIARQLELVRAQKAHAGVEFSTKGMIPTDLKGAVEGMGVLPAVRQNMRALFGRVVEPGARGVAKVAPEMGARLGIPLLRDPAEAIEARRKQKVQKREGR